MSIDFSYPNDEAVDALGVLTQHDDETGHEQGWTRSVINKIEADILNSPQGRDRSDSFDRSDYDAEELAAWDWYQDEVVDTDHWNALVEAYREDQADPSRVQWDPYDPDTDYIHRPGSGFEPPIVQEYGGGDNPNRQLSVSTEAINYFAKQLDLVAGDGTGMLLTARDTLNQFEMKPGGFARAEILRQAIHGEKPTAPGLRQDTAHLMEALHEALFEVKAGLRYMVREYDSTEEFNGVTSEDFADLMSTAWSKIGKIGDYGQDEITTEGG